jgi:hypothetical protein
MNDAQRQAERERDAMGRRRERANAAVREREREAAAEGMRNYRAGMVEDEQHRARETAAAGMRRLRAQRNIARGPTLIDLDGVEVVPFYSVGPMNIECSNCGCLHFSSERVQGKSTFYDCCCHAKFPDGLTTWPDYPEELADYFIGNYRGKQAFFDHIRAVNNTLALGCFCSHDYKHKSRGPPCKRIYGQTYHTINKQVEALIGTEGRFSLMLICGHMKTI